MRTVRADQLILAFDIGSSSTRTAIFDEKGRLYPGTVASVPYLLRYTSDGGAELSPFLLRRAAEECLAETVRKHRASPLGKVPIVAVAASSLWHALVGLDRHGRPVTPVLTWADARAVDDAARLRDKLSERTIHARTGCMLRATFWPAKISWLKRTRPRLVREIAAWASPADWVFRRLFGTTGCSQSMASATGFYNLEQRKWDEELCAVCQVTPVALPSISEQSGSWLRSPVYTAIGDGAAGNLGSGADRAGIIAINVGTSAAARMVQTNAQAAHSKIPFGLFRYVVDRQRLVMGGAVSNAGNLRTWCIHELRLKEAEADRALSRTEAAADSLTVLPFWVSERAPTWPERQLGLIDGLTQRTRTVDLLRSLTTAVYYRIGQICDVIEAATARPRRIIVSGGIEHSIAAMRLLADAIGRDLEIARVSEASLRGAAIFVLNRMGIEVKAGRSGNVVKCNRTLASKHRERRQRQIELEALLTSNG